VGFKGYLSGSFFVSRSFIIMKERSIYVTKWFIFWKYYLYPKLAT